MAAHNSSKIIGSILALGLFGISSFKVISALITLEITTRRGRRILYENSPIEFFMTSGIYLFLIIISIILLVMLNKK
ncbi:hypothetical protein Kkor_2403 [Kangiella koreensis DSM 16069]|uniref:Uncharacterized protein n=1 Tax=Kangiella koreensis (strain DSM 16069 / JCM 12317 / KCTC 12182 / SW-125) TaxID=523791 RepID=C7R922_KANKD|nr:hypothetical protein Kkor_2403 [Kangiella koreensis DSM 16069]